jgi:hypothetical protein
VRGLQPGDGGLPAGALSRQAAAGEHLGIPALGRLRGPAGLPGPAPPRRHDRRVDRRREPRSVHPPGPAPAVHLGLPGPVRDLRRILDLPAPALDQAALVPAVHPELRGAS